MDGVRLVAGGAAAADEPTSPALAGRVIGACRFVDPTSGQPVDGTIGNGAFTVTGFRVARGVLQVAGTLAGRLHRATT